jgi:drug/metabolite transporter (DMT)-like permease
MLAILGGLGAAVVFATVTLCNSRSSRMLGPSPLLGWIMLEGLVIVGPLAAAQGIPDGIDGENLGWLAVAGVGNVAGLLFAYAALRAGKVGIVAPLVSTQGAIAAAIAVIAGESLGSDVALLLAVIAGGVFLAAIAPDPRPAAGERPDPRPAAGKRPGSRAALNALSAALAIGFSLYAIGRVSVELPVVWALLPSRLLGFAAVTIPLALASRLRITTEALPLVIVAGVGEIAGFALFALGARHGLAVSAVLASLFGAIAAIAAYPLFRERLAPVQMAGVVVIVAGVGILSGVQA